jgi:hypothetical protein
MEIVGSNAVAEKNMDPETTTIVDSNAIKEKKKR